MSISIERESIGQAWVETFRRVSDCGGKAVNVTTTVTNPAAPEIAAIRALLDEHLVSVPGGNSRIQSVATVANTIFPSALYMDPNVTWSDGDIAGAAALDRAASRLYARYGRNLPTLRRAHGTNKRGTYFGRLTSWETPGGTVNQLDDRIRSFRRLRAAGYRTWNANELAIGREAEDGHVELLPVTGLDMYRVSDHGHYISRGFPCLVHIDLTLFEGKIHVLALYRHQYLITKAYGNLLGIARLQRFLAQQSGYELGELTMQAGFSDAEWTGLWTKTKSTRILAEAAASLT